MKYTLLILCLALTACTSESNENKLKNDLRETQLNLDSCKSRLEFYTMTNTVESNPTTSTTTEPEATPEPNCTDVDFDTLYVDGKRLDHCEAEAVESKECGIMATNCDSGMAYACLKNVSYKTETKHICE